MREMVDLFVFGSICTYKIFSGVDFEISEHFLENFWHYVHVHIELKNKNINKFSISSLLLVSQFMEIIQGSVY